MISLRNIFFNRDIPKDCLRVICFVDVLSNAERDSREIPATNREAIIIERSSGSCFMAVSTHGISSDMSASSTKIASGTISIGIFDRGMDFRQNRL